MCIFWKKTLECTRSVFSLFDVCGNVQISSGEWVSRNSYIPPNVPSYLHLILRPPHYLSLPFFYCSSFIFFQCFFLVRFRAAQNIIYCFWMSLSPLFYLFSQISSSCSFQLQFFKRRNKLTRVLIRFIVSFYANDLN